MDQQLIASDQIFQVTYADIYKYDFTSKWADIINKVKDSACPKIFEIFLYSIIYPEI